MELDPVALGMQPVTETYDVIGEVGTWVHDLERRWQEEETRKRVFVTPDESAFTVSVPTNAPPQVAWEFITTPGRRRMWQAGVIDVVVTDARGGRRGVGATNHCVHGSGRRRRRDPRLAAVRLFLGSFNDPDTCRPPEDAQHT